MAGLGRMSTIVNITLKMVDITLRFFLLSFFGLCAEAHAEEDEVFV
jgi:hypothetical protein